MRSGGTRTYNVPQEPDSLLFVDLSAGVKLEQLRSLPAAAIRDPRSQLLIRAEHPDPKTELTEILERWGLGMHAGLLIQACGEKPSVETLVGLPEIEIERARAIELEALCDWGQAIWTPRHHHYRLPSGEHAPSFIKLADAIRAPRDARVMASWLLPHLQAGTGVVIDTGTLTPIVESLRTMMKSEDKELGAVSVLDQYPRTAVDVDGAVGLSAGDSGEVLAVLSVNSSGMVRDRLMLALDRMGASLRTRQLVVMVDKDEPSARPEIETWSPLVGRPPLLERGVSAGERCPLCSDSRRSRLIPIDPFSFDGELAMQLAPVMPSIDDAEANWRLWERCDHSDAIAVESAPVVHSPARTDVMSVRVRLDRLLSDSEFSDVVVGRLDEPIGPSDREFRADSDLVLVAEEEANLDGFESFWERIREVVAPGQAPVPFSRTGAFSPELDAKLGAAERVLVLGLGTVSGWSMQRALVGVQHAVPRRDLDIQGLVVHARPATQREWITLCNSYGRRLYAAFLSVIPERSPLQDERVLLSTIDSNDLPSDDARSLFEERLSLCNGEAGPEGQPAPLYYGEPDDAVLTRNSIFGSRLDARSTYAALASAMARARSDHDDRAVPETRVFDLTGVLRSYYDPLIIASFLRWLEPFEAWWGWKAQDASRTIGSVLARAEEDDLKVLVPELLLARAQGKVHDAAYSAIHARADQLREVWDGRNRAAIDLTIHLARAAATEFAAPHGAEGGPSAPL